MTEGGAPLAAVAPTASMLLSFGPTTASAVRPNENIDVDTPRSTSMQILDIDVMRLRPVSFRLRLRFQ